MKKLLLLSLLVFVLHVVARSQPQHVGVLGNFQFEGAAGGNGTIVGVELQDVHHLRIASVPLVLATNVSFTVDKKVYRNQFGGAVRALSLLRYHPASKGAFVEAGIGAGGIAFPDTPGTDDGYVKYIARPVAGAGYAYNAKAFSVVADYQFHFKRKLVAEPYPLGTGKRVVDGWSSGQRIALSATMEFKPKWLLLINAAGGVYTYQRNPAYYGAQLGSVVHRFNAYELSLGIGRKYGL